MEAPAPHRLFDRLVLALVLAVMVAPLTYLEVAQPSWQQLSTQAHRLFGDLPAAKPSTTTAQPTPKPTPAPAATKPAAKPSTPAVKTATTTTLVHLREGKSVSSTNLTDIDPGTTVQLRDDSDATWQGVTYKGKNGYIYRDYLQY